MIRYRPHDNPDSIILAEAFPRKVAMAFSGLCQKMFPSLQATSFKDLCKPRENAIIIEGGSIQYHREVLEWMLSCCEGSGIRPFKFIADKPFWNYANALASAQSLQIAVLEKELSIRLCGIAGKQVHSDDVREIYTLLPCGHPIRSMAADSIGAALQQHRLLARGAYEVLKSKFPKFNEDLDIFMDAHGEKRAELKKAGHEARKAKKKLEQERCRRRAEENAQYPWNERVKATTGLEAEELKVRVDDSMTTHITAPAPIARKAAKGRPTYLKANPVLLGLTARKFRPERQQRPSKSSSKDTSSTTEPTPDGSIELSSSSTPVAGPSSGTSSEHVGGLHSCVPPVERHGEWRRKLLMERLRRRVKRYVEMVTLLLPRTRSLKRLTGARIEMHDFIHFVTTPLNYPLHIHQVF